MKTPPVRLEDFPGFLLRCASNAADAAYYQVLGGTDVTPRQFAVMLTLKNHGPSTQRQLSALTKIDSSTINEMIPRMIERGLLASKRSEKDRRSFEVALAERGRQKLREVLPLALKSQENILASVPAEYRRILLHSLTVIVEGKDGTPPEPIQD